MQIVDGVTKTEGELHFSRRIGNLGLQGSKKRERLDFLRSRPSCFHLYGMETFGNKPHLHIRVYERL